MEIKKTPLNAEHRALKARMINFGGWEMPVQYTSVMEEHRTVRAHVGLFDVSHMGEIQIEGPKAEEFLSYMVTNNVASLNIGQAQYNAMCYENGTIVDDIIVYRRGKNCFFLCVNAANVEKDLQWLKSHAPKEGVTIEDLSASYGQIAIQGPKSRELVQKVVDIQIQNMPYYHFAEGKVLGVPAIIARTGYTGELGFELYIPAESTPKVWNALLEIGAEYNVKPIGLGARDTLRLEVAYLLYGNDMDNTTTALECGLGWITKFQKGNFIGRDVLLWQKEHGVARKLVGIEMVDKAIARHGYKIYANQESFIPLGVVTSGAPGPSTNTNIAMGYVPTTYSELGTELWIDVRGERRKAKVVKRPFYTQGSVQS